MRRSRSLIGLCGAAALAAGLLAAAPVEASAPAQDARLAGAGALSHGQRDDAAKAGQNGWKQMSTHATTIISIPDVMALPSGGIQAVWAEPGDTTSSIQSRVARESGTLGSRSTVVSGWSSLIRDPQVINHNGDRMVVFAGAHSATTGDPLNVYAMLYSVSSNGRSWTLGGGSLSQNTGASNSYGTAAIDDAGTPLIAYTSSVGVPNAVLTLHRGIDPSRPAASPDWGSRDTGCCSYLTGMARDTKTGDVYAGWFSNASKKKENGILVEKVYPTPVGRILQAPSSSQNGNSIQPLQNVALSSRKGGGVYAAYAIGYPSITKIVVWKVATSKRITLPAKSATGVTLVPGPGGRLWLAWYDNTNGRVKVTRTNPAATKLGKVLSLKPPGNSGGSDVWAIAGSGETGPLHLVVNANIGLKKPQVWYQKVLPGLTVVATPRSLDKGKVTVRVSDAGAAIAGARVRFGDATKTTNSKGVTTFAVGKGMRSGVVHVKATKAGYAAGTASVKVT